MSIKLKDLVAVPSAHCLDAKNRMRLPLKFREKFDGQTYYVMKGEGKWLDVLTEDQVNEKVELLKKLPDHNLEVHALMANYFASGMEVKEDTQNRFILPADLRRYAEIEKNIYVVQGLKNIEIFSEKVWNDSIVSAPMTRLSEWLSKLEDQEKDKA